MTQDNTSVGVAQRRITPAAELIRNPRHAPRIRWRWPSIVLAGSVYCDGLRYAPPILLVLVARWTDYSMPTAAHHSGRGRELVTRKYTTVSALARSAMDRVPVERALADHSCEFPTGFARTLSQSCCCARLPCRGSERRRICGARRIVVVDRLIVLVEVGGGDEKTRAGTFGIMRYCKDTGGTSRNGVYFENTLSTDLTSRSNSP